LESSILNHRKRYELIHEKRSFSFEKNRLNGKYVLKLVVLISLISILTWYSKQEANNPFGPAHTLIVRNNNNQLTVGYLKKNKKISTVTIISPSLNPHYCALIKNASSWNLLSKSNTYDSSCINNPPAFWGIIDTLPNVLPEGWPLPVSGTEIKNDYCSLKRITLFNDNSPALLFQVGLCKCLIIEGPHLTAKTIENFTFNEKIELLILVHTTSETQIRLREILRPQFTISAPGSPELQKFTNTICLDSITDSLTFSLSSSKTLKLLNKSPK
jgi:hypothetical protein